MSPQSQSLVDAIHSETLARSHYVCPVEHSALQLALKRVMDIVGSVLLLAILSPVFLYVALVVRRDGGDVFYGDRRVGQHGKPFRCLKFRTMVPNANAYLKALLESDPILRAEFDENYKLKNDPRVTRIGSFLRRSSLDELPQLWNVLRGDMSLVGPRPMDYGEPSRWDGESLPYYLAVRPGMTGLWQIKGRSSLDYKTRIEMNIEYVKNWSLLGDIWILLMTPKVVFETDKAA